MRTAILIALAAVPAAALAQADQPAATKSVATAVGATVIGKDSQPAGTIAQITADAIVIDTGTNKVPVPVASIGTSPKGPTIAMTKADLDAAYAHAVQQAQASLNLAEGTAVHGLNDAIIGTIKDADAQFVTVTTPKGDVKLSRAGFGPGRDGSVRVNATAEQIDAAVAGAPAAAPAANAAPVEAGTEEPADKPKP